jgi:hypothetical protein
MRIWNPTTSEYELLGGSDDIHELAEQLIVDSTFTGALTPVVTRILDSPSNTSVAVGATVTVQDKVVTPTGSVGRYVDIWWAGLMLGASTTSAAGLIEVFDVTDNVVIGVSRWHNKGVVRLVPMHCYAHTWVPAGTPHTIRVRISSDSGSGITFVAEDQRIQYTYSDI